MRTLVTLQNPESVRQTFSAETIARLNSLPGVEWLPPGDRIEQGEFERLIADYDACITSWKSPKLSAEAIGNAQRLRFIGHAGGTLAPYVDVSAFDRDIIIINSNRQLAMSAAELTLTIMLGGAWNLAGYGHKVRAGSWSNARHELVMGVYGQTIGLIGMGEIARQLIRMLAPFHPRILVSSPHCSVEEAGQLGVELVEMEDLLRQSQIISLHDTLTERTHRFITRQHIEMIRDGALFVNAARAGLVDTAALLDHLRTGRFHAAMDNYDEEPLPLEHEFRNMPNVLCTPHIGGLSSYWRKKVGENVVDALALFLAGEEPPHRVTRERFLAMTSGALGKA